MSVTLEIIDQVTELTVEETVINLSIEDKIIQLEVNPAGVKGPMGPVGNAEWGLITGTLSDQLDLQTELDTKADVSHIHAISDINALQDALDDKADNIHTHEITDVNSLQTALDNKSNLGHTHSISGVTGLQAALDDKAPLVHNHDDRYYTESETDTLLNGKANSVHTHAISDVTNLQSSLDGKAAANHNHDDRYYTETEIDTMLSGVGSGSGDMLKADYDSNDDGKVNAADTADSVAWAGVTGKPATFAPSAHTHPASDVTGLSTVATSGDYDDLTDKPTLGTAAPLNVPASGNAASGEVVKGNDTRLTDARTPTTHNHDDRYYTESEIDTALAGKSNTGHTHTKSDITDFAHTHVKADITDFAHTHPQSDITNLVTDLSGKQATLVSGTNIKTINGESVLGSGDIEIVGGGGVSDGDKGDIIVSSSGSVWRAKLDETKYQDRTTLGTNIPFQPHLAFKRIQLLSTIWNNTTLSNIDVTTPSGVGSVTGRSVSTANFLASIRRLGYLSAGTAGSAAGLRQGSNAHIWRGDAAGLGGFFFNLRFGISQVANNYIFYAGLFGTAAAIGATTQPSSLVNIIGVGKDATDTTLQILHNDGSGTATKVNTGITPSTTAAYVLRIYCPPNGSTVYISIEDLSSGSVFETSTSADIPANTQLLTWHLHISNNATATAVSTEFINLYIETEN